MSEKKEASSSVSVYHLVEQLDESEKVLLKVMTWLDVSVSKNVDEHTIGKRLAGKNQGINPRSVLESLRNKGLVREYRGENWAFTKSGYQVSVILRKEILEDIKRKSGLSQILKHG